MYKFIKKVEEKAAKELLQEEEIEENEIKNSTPQKKGSMAKQCTTINKRKDELY
jgi:hypothetical protein